MGYIMPVDRYQYINYRDRVPVDQLSVAPVNPTFRTILEKSHQEVMSEYDRKLPSSYKSVPLQPSQPHVERTYAEITGAGRRFSESI